MIKKESNRISVSLVNGGEIDATPFPIYKNDLIVATMDSLPEPSQEVYDKIQDNIKSDNTYQNTLKIIYNTDNKTNDIKGGVAYLFNSAGKPSFIVTLERICKTDKGNVTYNQLFIFDLKGNVLYMK